MNSMKIVSLIFIILIFNTTCQLKTNHKSNQNALYVHFQGGFDNDSTFIYRNENLIYKNKLQTIRTLGFATEVKIPEYSSIDSVKIIVINSGDKYELILEDIKEKFVGVWLSDAGLRFHTKNSRFTYE